RRSNLPQREAIVDAELPEFVTTLIDKTALLQQSFCTLKTTLASVGYTHGDRKLHALQNVLIHIATAINGSGILAEGYCSWLEDVRTNRFREGYREVEAAYLMQEEVSFHLQRLSRMTQLYLASGACKQTEIRQALEGGLLTLANP